MAKYSFEKVHVAPNILTYYLASSIEGILHRLIEAARSTPECTKSRTGQCPNSDGVRVSGRTQPSRGAAGNCSASKAPCDSSNRTSPSGQTCQPPVDCTSPRCFHGIKAWIREDARNEPTYCSSDRPSSRPSSSTWCGANTSAYCTNSRTHSRPSQCPCSSTRSSPCQAIPHPPPETHPIGVDQQNRDIAHVSIKVLPLQKFTGKLYASSRHV
jgi:hypothetical protein